jgi:hypothetical protein
LRLYNDLWRRLVQNKLDIGVSGGQLISDDAETEDDIYEQKPEIPIE